MAADVSSLETSSAGGNRMRFVAGLVLAILPAVVLTSERATALEENDTLARWTQTSAADQEAFAQRLAAAASAYNGPKLPVSYFVDCINGFARVQSMHNRPIKEIGGFCVTKATQR
jgi:hypothetical protein